MDFTLSFHGSVWLLCPHSEDARAWVREFVAPDVPRFGRAVAIDSRNIDAALEAIRANGLIIID